MEVLTTSVQFKAVLEALEEGTIGVLYVSANWCSVCVQLKPRWKVWVENTDTTKVKFWSFDIARLTDEDNAEDLSITEYIGLSPAVPHVRIYKRELGLTVISDTLTGSSEISKRMPAILSAAQA